MNKILFLSLLFFPLTLGLATPPTSISLTYDLDKQSLHVEAVHHTEDLLKNYVRLMNVYVNGNQVLTLSYNHQTDYEKFTDDAAVTAQEGDVIKVDLFCFSGGELAQELKVRKGISSTDAGGDSGNGG